MGWGKLLGDVAKGMAQGYISERGVKGTLEDVGELASGVKNFFNSGDSSDEGVTWDDLIEHVSELINNGEYSQALDDLNEYYTLYEDDEADVWYFYWRAVIEIAWLESFDDENFDDVNQALTSDISEARKYRNTDINKELEDIVNRQKETVACHISIEKWSKMKQQYDNLVESEPEKALQLLEEHYQKNENGCYDYAYFRDKAYGLICVYLLTREHESKETCNKLETLYKQVSECLNGMKENLGDNPLEEQKENIKYCEECLGLIFGDWKEDLCGLYTNQADFEKARKIAYELKFSDPVQYKSLCSRIESTYLIYLIDNGETSIKVIEKQLKAAENALEEATSSDDDHESRQKRIEIVTEKLERAKKYMASLQAGSGSKHVAVNNTTISSDNEQQYLEEVKACYAEDDVISDRERRLLDRLRKSMGISEARAKEIEALANPKALSKNETEYMEELKACIENDGVISDKERRLLNRLRIMLDITEERAAELEKMII